MIEPEQRFLRFRDCDELLRCLTTEDRAAFYRAMRRLDEISDRRRWIDDLQVNLELALNAAASGVFNWPCDRSMDVLHFVADSLRDAPPCIHVVTRRSLRTAEDHWLNVLADYYDTHDIVTGEPLDKESEA